MQNTIVKEFENNPDVVARIWDQGGQNGETRSWLESWWENYFLRGSVIFDAAGNTAKNVYAQPSTGLPFGRGFIIDRQGKVAYPFFGHRPQWVIDRIYELLEAAQEPAPDIKVNGSDGPISAGTADMIEVTIALDPGDLAGDPADWWVYVQRDAADIWWAEFRSGQSPKWTKSAAPIRFAGATLRTVNGFTVLGPRTMPAGVYDWTFSVDEKNGAVEDTYTDTVRLTVN